jgi:hypothetical protein
VFCICADVLQCVMWRHSPLPPIKHNAFKTGIIIKVCVPLRAHVCVSQCTCVSAHKILAPLRASNVSGAAASIRIYLFIQYVLTFAQKVIAQFF